MIIPPEEREIAVLGDNMSSYRIFSINRYIPDGADLSALTFKIDMRYSPTEKNTNNLEKTITDEKIELRWDIVKNDLPYTGTMFIQIRGTDEYGTVKWRSAEAAVYCLEGISSENGFEGDLSELESLEAKVSKIIDSEKSRVAAEEARQTAEQQRQQAELEREEGYSQIIEECETAA